MAKLLIIEGLERSGKSTQVQILRQLPNVKGISLKNKEPFDIVKNMGDYHYGMHVIMLEVYKEFPDCTFVLDRSFISEFVYSEWYNRKVTIHDNAIEQMFKENDVYLFYFHCCHDKYIERKPKNKNLLSEKDFNKQRDLFNKYYNKYSYLGNFHQIKTNIHDIEYCKNYIINTAKI